MEYRNIPLRLDLENMQAFFGTEKSKPHNRFTCKLIQVNSFVAKVKEHECDGGGWVSVKKYTKQYTKNNVYLILKEDVVIGYIDLDYSVCVQYLYQHSGKILDFIWSLNLKYHLHWKKEVFIKLRGERLGVLGVNIDTIKDPRYFEYLSCFMGFYLRSAEIEYLPKEISFFKDLKELYLENNPLKELPEELCNLKKLKKIYVFGTPENMIIPEKLKEMNVLDYEKQY